VVSLDEKVYIDGCSEVIKYGVIRDAELFEQLVAEMPKSVRDLGADSGEDFQILECVDLAEKLGENFQNMEGAGLGNDFQILEDVDLDMNFQILENVVARCVEIKADVVNADERDTGVRQLLNFGHTIGHAFEAISDFELSHGFAVALGMSVICKIAVAEGMCEADVSKRVDDILKAYGLPFDMCEMGEQYDFSPENIAKYMSADKKHVDDYINLIVPNKIGECVIRKTSDAEVDEWIRRL